MGAGSDRVVCGENQTVQAPLPGPKAQSGEDLTTEVVLASQAFLVGLAVLPVGEVVATPPMTFL